MARQVLAIIGPTSSGKSQVGMIVAERMNCEIISADSRQIYKYLDIGTAKPTVNNCNKIVHHFVDELLPDQDFNAGEYLKQGRNRIEEIFNRGRQPLIVGGSGLYIGALVDGFFEGPQAHPEIRSELEDRMQKEGIESLVNELRNVDPISAAKMLPSNTRRIVRALEVYKITGTPISKHHKTKDAASFKTVFVGLMWERKQLYKRIDERVDWMFHNGLLNEVKNLIEMGYSLRNNSLQTVGYQEVFKFFEGAISFEYMVELIKRNSRRYAKRQLAWFRRNERIKWFDIKSESDFDMVAEKIISHFKNSVVFSE
jgi:tRNA dimethylallyltransferase